MKISVPWGDQELSFELPEEGNINVLKSKKTPPFIENIEKKL